MRPIVETKLLFALAACATLAACNSGTDEPSTEPQQAVAAQPTPVLTTAPTPTAAPDGTALVAGTWTVTEDALAAKAYFAEEGLSPSLELSCPRGAVAVTMFVASAATEPQSWRLDAGGEAARIDMAPTTQPAPGLAASVDQSLGIITALAATGQTFMLTSPGGQRLQFPTHPGVIRIIDACQLASPQGTP